MKIALLGYGKMGKTIHALMQKGGKDQLILKTNSLSSELTADDLRDVEVAIEFSRPNVVLKNIEACLQNGVPIVVGTTGWYTHFAQVSKQVRQHNGSLFYASNFSLGVNVFYEINKKLAALMAKYPQYNVDIQEIHHTEKLDAPSGTAITLANQILPNYPQLKGWHCGANPPENHLPITALRQEAVKGTHEIKYSSNIDEISIVHKAFSREGFALGAVQAAHWLKDKRGIFTMTDMIAQ